MQPPANKKPSYPDFRPKPYWRWLGDLAILLVWLAILAVVMVNRQAISDWFRLRNYTPLAAIAQLASQDTMNAYTRHLFYLNRPQLLPTVASFRKDCPENEDTIVLGCYHSGQNGIFIYKVQDPTLSGVWQVTAAHEVLHSVYARLSSKDRTALDTELENYYHHGLTDPRVLAEVKLYQQTEPNDVMDEMSCTFGTEIANLPASLEAYYKRYFDNRAAIVAYEQQYEGEFTSRQATVSTDDQQLASLKQQINSQQSALTSQLAQINADQARLNSLRSSGQTFNYNAAVPAYNSEVDVYNNGVDSLSSQIANYNQLVATRNAIAGQLTILADALDTRVPQTVAH